MTRDDARHAFAASGLSYDDLTQANLRRLISLIDADMKESGLMEGFRMRRKCKLVEIGGQKSAALRCKAFYFDDREAVTFNPDGFVGFGGWADDENIRPILSGFTAWVREMAAVKRHSLRHASRSNAGTATHVPSI